MQILNRFSSRLIVWLICILGAILLSVSCTPQDMDSKLRLGTTTSVENSGLLEYLLKDFEDEYEATVDVIAVGTGQALALGERGDVDIVLVHAPILEAEFIADGYGLRRHAVMFNDFIILGPLDDPAGVRNSSSGAAVLAQIAASAAPFASRGDSSGTHIREMELWEEIGYIPLSEENWYYSLGQGMGLTLNFANEFSAYVLTDRGTYLSQKKVLPHFMVVYGGPSINENTDANLVNYYSVIPVNPTRHTEINSTLAEKFVSWLTNISTQEKIYAYGIEQFGQPLFYPNSDDWRQSEESASIQGDIEGQQSLDNSNIMESMLMILQGD